jgi:protein-L-isoaspartate(D-aspartate) O-methyltransferase
MRISKNLRNGSCKESRISPQSEYTVARRKMVEQLRLRGIFDERVLEVMGALPRHYFVDEALIPQAYNDSPLNIGFGQTISQPYTVAFLAQSLNLKGSEIILEIGTGCGYQTAVLASLARQIFSIERLSSLLMKARANLKRLSIKNVVLKYGDGSRGWPEKAPFHAVVAAAVSPKVPQPLLNQLADGGSLVIPIQRDGKQYLVRVVREGSSFEEVPLEECRFVRMVGDYAFGEDTSSGRKISGDLTQNRVRQVRRVSRVGHS